MQAQSVTSNVYNEVWLYIIFREQQKILDINPFKRLVPVSVTMSLTKFHTTFNLIRIGGWTKIFPRGFSSDNNSSIPITPY